MSPFTRLVSYVRDPYYDPEGEYFGTSFKDDPFLYRISERYQVTDTRSGRVLGYELHGIPIGFREDWRVRMLKRGEVNFFTSLHPDIDVEKRYKNGLDANDPYVYAPTKYIRRSFLGFVVYQFYGVAVDVQEEWKIVVREAQRVLRGQQHQGAWDAWEAYEEKERQAKEARGDYWHDSGYAGGHARGRSPHAGRPLQELREVLGVSELATAQEIKVAYRRLVRVHHPDVDKSPGAHDRFLLVQEAYERLIVIAR